MVRHCQTAVAIALTIFVLGVVVAATAGGYAAIGALLFGPLLIALVAGPFAIAAFVKRDGPTWCAVVALVASFGPAIAIVGTYLMKQADEAAYQNRMSAPGVEPALDPPVRSRLDPAPPLPEPSASEPSAEPPPEQKDLKVVPPGTELFRPPVIPERR